MASRAEFDIGPGRVLNRFGRDEVKPLLLSWMKIFGVQPAPGFSKYMWHVFSYGNYPSVALEVARRSYDEHASPEYVVLSNDRDRALVTDQRPESCSISDYYVFPRNLAWTMSFTHEDGWLGPYFAKHPQYEKLNAENLQKVRKAEAASEAKRKGYR
jgi:hypothetical protein